VSNEAEDPTKFALFPREGFEPGEAGHPQPEDGGRSDALSNGGANRGAAEAGGRRGLVWGVLLTVIALMLSGVGHRLAPVEARVSLVTGGVLVLGFYVMSSVRVLSRPNGLFLGLAFAFLLVASVPVGMSLWQGAADYAARIRVAEVAELRGGSSAGAMGSVPIAPTAVTNVVSGDKSLPVSETTADKAVVDVAGSVGQPAPALAAGATLGPVGVPPEERLSVEEREAKIAAMAEISAPVMKRGLSPKALVAGGLPGESVSLGQGSSSAGMVSGLSQKEFSEKVLQSKLQVVQRYPALGRNGSDEVKVYTEVFNELVRRNRDFFSNPDWPLELAEMVGKREGWIPEEGSVRK